MTEISHLSDLQALERLVVENDALSELELLIGRFNVFDALNVARAEIRHSNFLAWLLDPAESHGQGLMFLRPFLMDLLKEAPSHLRPFSPVELDGADLRGVEIRREWKRVDILIACKEPSFVIALENKVDSSEHGDQLQEYEAVVSRHFPQVRTMFVYLTRAGEEASSARWVSYGYADIYRVLDRCRKTYVGAVGGDVSVFLDHYLRLIGSRFMDDPKVDDLCQRIYRNHRQALDLIYERVGAPTTRLVRELEDLVRGDAERWEVCHRTTKEVHFVPKPWVGMLPAIGRRKNVDQSLWVRLGFWCGEDRCTIWCWGYPTENPSLRKAVLERLVRDVDEFGLRAPRRGITSDWTSLGSEDVHTWDAGDEPDRSELLAKALAKLNEWWVRMANVPAAIQPLCPRG